MGQSTSRVVVGVDGSESSLAALRWAVQRAAETGQAVEVVHSYYWHSLRDFAFGGKDELARGSICMLDNEVTAALRGREIAPTVTKTSVRGRPGRALADNAMSASLVVIGASGDNAAGHGHLERFLTDHVQCPVVVVSLDGTALREPVAG